MTSAVTELRTTAAVRQLRDIIRSGQLGRDLYIDSARLSLGLYQRDVNVIWDLAPHDISITSYLLDELPVATSVWAQRNVGPLQEDVAYLRLLYSDPEVTATIHLSWGAGFLVGQRPSPTTQPARTAR